MLKESTQWYLFLLAGLVLLAVLGIHYGVMHLGGLFGYPRSEVLSFGSVHERSGQVFFLVVYLILLVAALYHGLYGLRAIIFELSATPVWLRRTINVVLIVAGWGFFFFGSWAIIAGFLG
jgi:succinate dehydrogenase hydrophobic anchor subunit